MDEFRRGSRAIVAFRTEIAEPDREGGSFRYRGVDIEELVGARPSSRSGGCSWTSRSRPGLEPAEPLRASRRRRATPVADLQAATRPSRARDWGLGKLIDISDEQAKEDLRRALVARMISIVAQSARLHDGEKTPVDPGRGRCRRTAAERFLLEWRGEADPRHVKAIDTYWICTAEHGMNASTFTARVVASTGADCAACLSSAVGALSGPLHGGAPARVLPMLDAAAEAASVDDYVKGLLDSARAAHGLRPPRLPGRGSARADPAASGARSSTRRDTRSPSELERVALAALARAPPRAGARDERRVLVGRRARRRRRSRRTYDAGDVRVARRTGGWSAHILEQKRDRAPRPAARPCTSARAARERWPAASASVGPRTRSRPGPPSSPTSASSPSCATRSTRRSRRPPAARTSAQRAVAFRAVGQMRFRQKTELLRRGLEDESPACRGSALLSLEPLSRDHAGVVNGQRSLLHQLANADPNAAVRRLAVLALKNGSPHSDTLVLLDHIADSDEEDASSARRRAKVADALKKKARAQAGRPLGRPPGSGRPNRAVGARASSTGCARPPTDARRDRRTTPE